MFVSCPVSPVRSRCSIEPIDTCEWPRLWPTPAAFSDWDVVETGCAFYNKLAMDFLLQEKITLLAGGSGLAKVLSSRSGLIRAFFLGPSGSGLIKALCSGPSGSGLMRGFFWELFPFLPLDLFFTVGELSYNMYCSNSFFLSTIIQTVHTSLPAEPEDEKLPRRLNNSIFVHAFRASWMGPSLSVKLDATYISSLEGCANIESVFSDGNSLRRASRNGPNRAGGSSSVGSWKYRFVQVIRKAPGVQLA